MMRVLRTIVWGAAVAGLATPATTSAQPLDGVRAWQRPVPALALPAGNPATLLPARTLAMTASVVVDAAAAFEVAVARLWASLHHWVETLASFGACTRLADDAVDNVLRRR